MINRIEEINNTLDEFDTAIDYFNERNDDNSKEILEQILLNVGYYIENPDSLPEIPDLPIEQQLETLENMLNSSKKAVEEIMKNDEINNDFQTCLENADYWEKNIEDLEFDLN